MTQSNLLELAKQGDAQAIAALMNRQMQPKGITAKAALKDGCLQIMLESAQVPDQQALVGFVRRGITGLGAESIERVRVYGRQTGEEIPAWSQEFDLGVHAKSKISQNDQPLTTPEPTVGAENPYKDLINQSVNLLGQGITAFANYLEKANLERHYESFIYEKGHLFSKAHPSYVRSIHKSVYDKSIRNVSKTLLVILYENEVLLDVIFVKYQRIDF